MLKEKIISLRKSGCTINSIVSILGCSKSVVSYHINKVGLGNNNKITNDLLIKINEYRKEHTILETAIFFKLSKTTIKKYTKKDIIKKDRKRSMVESVVKRRKKVKEMAVIYKGGKCVRCGYNRYIGALEFHHIEPDKKDFGISSKGYTKSWESVKNELDKCILVCSNCHKEIHHEIIFKKN